MGKKFEDEATKNPPSIKLIVELKEENAKLEETIHLLKMENFEHALKCNRIENIISNIHSITKNGTPKLIKVSNEIHSILQMSSPPTVNLVENGNKGNEKTVAKTSCSLEKLPASNKAHVVNPHMVNGHILYIPTINLTRVSETHANLNTDTNSQLENRNDSLMESCSSTCAVSYNTVQPGTSNCLESTRIENEANGNSEENLEFTNDNQLSPIEEVTDTSTSGSPSKSPSHSTVLSGTFQEVKIYLNQISQDSLNEEPRKAVKASRGKKRLRKAKD